MCNFCLAKCFAILDFFSNFHERKKWIKIAWVKWGELVPFRGACANTAMLRQEAQRFAFPWCKRKMWTKWIAFPW
jgi:hypothetical protein